MLKSKMTFQLKKDPRLSHKKLMLFEANKAILFLGETEVHRGYPVCMPTEAWAANIGHAFYVGDMSFLLHCVRILRGICVLMLRQIHIPYHSQQEEGINILV